MTPRTSIARLADDAPVPHQDSWLEQSAPISAARIPPQDPNLLLTGFPTPAAPVPHPDSWPARKPPFISSLDCPDCGATKAATSVFGFFCEHDHCPIFERKPPSIAVQDAEPTPSGGTRAGRTGGAHPPTAAYDNARAAIRAQAERTVCRVVNERARDYLDEPWQLDMLRVGFLASSYSPEQLIEFAEEIRHQESMRAIRFNLVPVNLVNARAAILAGRYARAKAHQIARRTA
jgi:hypothetical protein